MLYSPVAGAVARLALLVTVSPSTLSSFTWFLFSSFSSFFLLSVRSLLTWGAPPPPPLVTCWPLSPWSGEKGPGGPRSLSILCHVWGGRGKISSLREKRLRVRDAEPRWWRSALNTHSVVSDGRHQSAFHLENFAQSKGRAKIVWKTKSLIWK